jgi:D-aminopeptidase
MEVAVVKKAEGRYCAKCLPKAESRKILTETARKAVSGIADRKCVDVPVSPVLEITFQQTCMADGTMRVKNIRRTGPMTVEYACSSMEEVMDMRQVISDAAGEFFDRRF